jgi:predicted permease
MILAASFGNVTYLGLPVITEMLGAQHGYVAILYDLLAATPILLTIGVFIAAAVRQRLPGIVRRGYQARAQAPPLWGVAAGMAVSTLAASRFKGVLETAGLIGKTVIPIMTFTVGLALDFKDLGVCQSQFSALVLKLGAAPVLAWWVGSQLGITGGRSMQSSSRGNAGDGSVTRDRGRVRP